MQLQEGENSRAIPGRPYLTRVTATGYPLCAKHGASPPEKVGLPISYDLCDLGPQGPSVWQET